MSRRRPILGALLMGQCERPVAGESSEFHDGDEMPVLRLMKATGDALEGRQIAHQVDVGLFASHGWGVSVIEEVAGQVFEGVVPTLPWDPRVDPHFGERRWKEVAWSSRTPA